MHFIMNFLTAPANARRFLNINKIKIDGQCMARFEPLYSIDGRIYSIKSNVMGSPFFFYNRSSNTVLISQEKNIFKTVTNDPTLRWMKRFEFQSPYLGAN